MKQAIKKKTFSRPSTDDIKSLLGLSTEAPKKPVKMSELKTSSAEKETEFIVLPKAFEDALKLPGIPKGYLTIATGWSNTGKSTIKNCLIAACQREGIMAVVYETEGNFDWKYAMDCGVNAEPIYGEIVDDETGEVTEGIVNYKAENVIYYDSTILADRYGDMDYSTGKKVSKKRKQAVLEDIAYSINEILEYQDEGKIAQPICFIWDSIGSIESFKSYASKSNNNMFNAGAIAQAFNNIINNRIPSSRKVSEPFTNTFFCVNKIWNDSMNSMGGAPSIELKGGKTMFYGARLVIHLGGIGKPATKKLDATAKGSKYQFGITTKIRTTKNQLPTPWNVTYEGEMSCVHNGLLNPEKLDEYKKTYIKDILERIEQQIVKDNENVSIADITEADIEFSENDSENDE